MDEKILTKHPEGKTGVNISKAKYDIVRSAVVGSLRGGRQLTHNELMAAVASRLTGKFDGSIPWYTECVKLDLEAHRVIGRTDTKPQRYQLLRT